MAKTDRYFLKASKNKGIQDDNHKNKGKFVRIRNENKLQTKVKSETFRKSSTHLKNVKIKKSILQKFDKGESVVKRDGLKTKYHHKLWQEREKQIKSAGRQSARTEVLLNEQEGYIDSEGVAHNLSQSEICANVDITSATKHFSLNLNQFGPYRMKYSENGKHLLLGGRKGHIVSIDWITKYLSCEMNIMEEVAKVSWLHNENMFAVAQKSYVHVYDNKVTNRRV